MQQQDLPIRVAIIGAGSLGQQIAQHLHQHKNWQMTGFFDDFAAMGASTPGGEVLGPVQAAQGAYHSGVFDALLMGIGYNHLAARQQLYERLVALVPFATFVHPAAYVDASATVAAGCFVSPGCVLDLHATLGPNTFLYPGCVLAHDVVVTGHSFLAPAVRLAGHVVLEQRCFLGIGTTVIDGISIGPDVQTGGSATVVEDAKEPGLYVGTPAKNIKKSS